MNISDKKNTITTLQDHTLQDPMNYLSLDFDG